MTFTPEKFMRSHYRLTVLLSLMLLDARLGTGATTNIGLVWAEGFANKTRRQPRLVFSSVLPLV